jgi:hypothetical protein
MTGLRSGDYEALMEHSPNTYPYGLVNATSEYTVHIPHLFVDPTARDHVLDLCLIDLPEPDHLVPAVNMVEIRQIREDSLSTIPKKVLGPPSLTRLTIPAPSLIHMCRSSQFFHPVSKAPSSPLATRRPIKKG